MKIKKQNKSFIPEIGDIYPFEDKYFLMKIPEKDESKYLSDVFTLSRGFTPFESLRELGIDTKDIEQKYTCPHSGLEFYSLIPYKLISTDLSIYMEETSSNAMAFDKEWQWDYEDHKELFKPSRLISSMIGSGYTCLTNYNDGSGDYIKVAIELENGDYLICLTWEWFNK